MRKQYTPDQLLDMTQSIKRRGWSAIYIKEEGVFKVSKRHLEILMDPEMYQEIFIERANRQCVNRGISSKKHNLIVGDIRVGMMLNIDDEYYIVLSIGCALSKGYSMQAAREYAVVAHISADDLTLCNLELNPNPDGIDAKMYLSKRLDIHRTHLN